MRKLFFIVAGAVIAAVATSVAVTAGRHDDAATPQYEYVEVDSVDVFSYDDLDTIYVAADSADVFSYGDLDTIDVDSVAVSDDEIEWVTDCDDQAYAEMRPWNLLERAVEGDPCAAYILAVRQAEDADTPEEMAAAVDMMQMAAMNGSTRALVKLATWVFVDEEADAEDISNAYDLLLTAARAGDPEAIRLIEAIGKSGNTDR